MAIKHHIIRERPRQAPIQKNVIAWVMTNQSDNILRFTQTNDIEKIAISSHVIFEDSGEKAFEKAVMLYQQQVPHDRLRRSNRSNLYQSAFNIYNQFVLKSDATPADLIDIFNSKIKTVQLDHHIVHYRHFKNPDVLKPLIKQHIHYLKKKNQFVHDPKLTKRRVAALKAAETRKKNRAKNILKKDLDNLLNALKRITIKSPKEQEKDSYWGQRNYVPQIACQFTAFNQNIDRIGEAILFCVNFFNILHGKNAHRKLHSFQKCKAKWKTSDSKTKAKYFQGFVKWMDQEAKMRNCQPVGLNDIPLKETGITKYLEEEI